MVLGRPRSRRRRSRSRSSRQAVAAAGAGDRHTAQPSTTGRQQALASGADAYLMKPFSVAAFAALVDRTLRR